MFPLNIMNEWSQSTEFFFAFLIGIGFGYFLEQGGFGNSRKLALTFYFKDMTVVKVMFTAIITAMVGLLVVNSLGLVDMEEIYLNPTYITTGILGAVIMGVGFAVGGYCPGTAVVGVATLKLDAIYNILGALLGMVIFAEMVPSFMEFYEEAGYMGDTVTVPEYFGISAWAFGIMVLIMAAALFAGSEWVEKKFGDKILN